MNRDYNNNNDYNYIDNIDKKIIIQDKSNTDNNSMIIKNYYRYYF